MGSAKLVCVETEHGSALYKEMVELRYRVFREPMGLSFTEEELLVEKTDIHIAALIDDTLVGCIVLSPVNDKTVRFRQMAVEQDFRGHRIGQRILIYAESVANAKGYEKVVLHARETATDFYKKSGYQIVEGSFSEVTVPHYSMEKSFL
jgi:predicted GNAT family N-acyltransferase